mgnify:FL=1
MPENSPNQPMVSIVVPVYKAERFLDECIRSIVGQTYSNLEIILVDDASPDQCPRICDEWAERDERVSVIHLDNGKGASGARNVGLDHCTGDYVMFVDSDDLLKTDAVRYSVKQVLVGDYDLVIFGKHYIDEYGNVSRTNVIDHDMAAIADESDYYTTLSYLLRADYLNPPWGKLFAHRLVEHVRFDAAMCYEEDLVFVLAALEAKPNVFASSKALYEYRHLENGLASVFRREKSLNVVQANHKKIQFFADYMNDKGVCENVSFHIANDIGWVIPMIKGGKEISASQKADYVMEMTGDSQLRPCMMKALNHSWMTRLQKILITLNWKWLWEIYLR